MNILIFKRPVMVVFCYIKLKNLNYMKGGN